MRSIALLSDNHSYFGEDVLSHVQDVDEIWHAGDIGSYASIEPLIDNKIFRAVHGNIDDQDIRTRFPAVLVFECEHTRVLITHIGGYPGKYPQHIKDLISAHQPDMFICGHSHICKVMYDHGNKLLHMNPGSYGHHGFHTLRTMLKFEINNDKIENAKAIELGLRGAIQGQANRNQKF